MSPFRLRLRPKKVPVLGDRMAMWVQLCAVEVDFDVEQP